jgi:hypothetical protein
VVKETRRQFKVVAEQLSKEIRAIGEGHEGNAERLDHHEKRIERLEDTAGLPLLEPVVEG